MTFREIGSLQLATLVDSLPLSEDWVHEIKYDGYRTLCRKDKKSIQLVTRGGLDWSKKYQSILKECEKLPVDSIVMDGEIVWLDNQGHSSFQGLQNALEAHRDGQLIYYVFDLLFLNGFDIRNFPLIERKKLLEQVIQKTKSQKIIYSSHWNEDGASVFKSACDNKLEGIISKNIHGQYLSGRGKNWLKIKCKNVQEFVIGGYTLQKNGASLGAVLLGAHNEKGEFQYLGKVGTGFNNKTSTNLLKNLKTLQIIKSPFEVKSPKGEKQLWVKPTLVANIEFAAWTEDKILRHAAFKELRKDKKASEVILELPVKKTVLRKKIKTTSEISSPDKVLYPEDQITKQDLLDYYKAIEKWIIPYLRDRPLALLRCPAGYDHTCFFQKHAETNEEGIKSQNIVSKLKEKKEQVLYIDSMKGLRELVQLGTLEIHVRGGDYQHIDFANQIVFDFDPDEGMSFEKVKSAAFELKALLEKLKLKSFIKVSGGKGVHVQVPVSPKYDWDEIKEFAKKICEQMESTHPEKYTTTVSKAKRKGKIFLDYLRNGYGATAIAPYSVRAREHAPVALPITWAEAKKLKSAHSYTLKEVPKLLKKRSDPWKGYLKLKQKIKVLDDFRKHKKR
ncbi:DNA ligase D [Bacteriovorax stolpii]|uniref:DNA ligase (ATP) n=1 Tax=Bacteriovorax stolpii TaxID=960 RepID=A0A2K9NMZ3_BACTC|nr:DNA ligase D [Bacteriovorax stolpii]AUN96896.1 DNA ligase D [Bacteriovorax stolpii]TDP53174.1 ATP-dependent DNA ligase LigD phosphoesterase module /ATP-dependent DNA ligase LigD polymerase module [Bacteriovorax stolpii]